MPRLGGESRKTSELKKQGGEWRNQIGDANDNDSLIVIRPCLELWPEYESTLHHTAGFCIILRDTVAVHLKPGTSKENALSVPEEHILVIPESVIQKIGSIEGFESDVDRFLIPILGSDQLSFEPRGAMETDPSFKQLIPYVLLDWTDSDGVTRLFTYTRGGGGGESRLHAKRSVGIGGHISREDSAEGADPYTTGMQRELAEEVCLTAGYSETREGLIYDPSNDVGKVHLGVVHRFVLEGPEVSSNEADLAEGGFVTIEDLRAERDRLETWSQLAIDALY